MDNDGPVFHRLQKCRQRVCQKHGASCVEQVAMRHRPQLRDGERYEGVARRRCHESIGHIAPTRATDAIFVAQLVAEDGHTY